MAIYWPFFRVNIDSSLISYFLRQLVAFIVGKFEYIETVTKNLPKPITCRVYVLPGKTEEAEFALSVTPLALEYFTELFGVAYPLPKMDLITIPDFESGAMENWGLVTYRAIRLLFNEKTSDLSYKRHIAVSWKPAHKKMQFCETPD